MLPGTAEEELNEYDDSTYFVIIIKGSSLGTQENSFDIPFLISCTTQVTLSSSDNVTWSCPHHTHD